MPWKHDYILCIGYGNCDYNNIIQRFKMIQPNDSLQLILALLYRIEQLYMTSIKILLMILSR